jgi:UDP-N-acetylglucosamine 2-epimerase (non-hydrolysing)
MRYKVLFVFGTRPEAIKLSPVILRMKKDRRFLPRVCVTAQHREMLDQVLGLFRIRPDHDLNIMSKGQDLFDITARGLSQLKKVLVKESPDMVVVQGDTTTTLAGSLAAFYMQIPVAHVEAGLRTEHKYKPFPEEINRRLTSHLADLHFAPTRGAAANLVNEGIPRKRISATGNTAVDALLMVKEGIEKGSGKTGSRSKFKKLFPFLRDDRRMILVTAHRRESFGEGFRNICGAIREIAQKRDDVQIVYPVHLNPNVKRPVNRMLRGMENVILIEPVGYEPFVYLMLRSYLILTDSGGIQEEAPSLGKPVLVMREVTERMESVEAGVSMLVGADRGAIVKSALRLLDDGRLYGRMARRKNPYGDGRASERIVEKINGYLGRKG